MEPGSGGRLLEIGRRVREYLTACVRIDTRTLAIFRMSLGLLVLADVLLRARNFSYFYTDAGVVPRSLARETAPVAVPLLYQLSTEPAVTAALFVLQALVAVGLLVGFKTRVATALSLVFVVSVDVLNPLVLSYADALFRLLLFWALFLPLGERWSIDAVHADRRPRDAVAGVASALALLQMIVMYVVNGYHKSQSELWTSGEAAVLVLGLDDTTFLLGDFVRSVPTLLQYGGLTWYYMLLFSWLLLFLRGRPRIVLVAMFASVHASFAVTVRIGAFGFVAIAGLLLFLQAQFWADGRALLERCRVPVSRLASRASRLERVAAAAPRWQFGPDVAGWLSRNASTIAVAVVLVVVGVSVLSAGGVVDDDIDPGRQAGAAVTAVVDHQTEWSIFAPNPRTTDRYYVFPAKTADGDLLDVYNERELTYDRPYDRLHRQYDTYRERFYMSSFGSDDAVASSMAEYLCAEWNDRGEELTHLNMYRVDEDVTLETIDSPADRDREAVLLYRHGCGDNEPTEIQPPDL